MSASAFDPVQKAIYDILSVDATLLALVDANGIVDAVPEPDASPAPLHEYVVLGTASELADNTMGGDGSDLLCTIESDAEDTTDRSGWRTATDIGSRVKALLDGAELTVEGWGPVLCHFEESTKIHDPPWRRVIQDYRVVVEEQAPVESLVVTPSSITGPPD